MRSTYRVGGQTVKLLFSNFGSQVYGAIAFRTCRNCPEVGNTVGKVNLSVANKGLRTNLKPLFTNLVAGAGFEPATFGLWAQQSCTYRQIITISQLRWQIGGTWWCEQLWKTMNNCLGLKRPLSLQWFLLGETITGTKKSVRKIEVQSLPKNVQICHIIKQKRLPRYSSLWFVFIKLRSAGPTRFELAISGLTGQRVNQATPRPQT